jgi:MFS family permease
MELMEELEMGEKKNSIPLTVAILSLAFVSQINTIASVIMADVAAFFPNASATAIQYVMQMGMIGGFPVSLTVGFLTRKFRIKSMLLVGLCCILAGGLFPLVNHSSLVILYICAFLVGAGQGFMAPMLGTAILQNFEGQERNRLIGLNTTFGTGGATVLLLIAGPVAVSNWVNTYFLYLIVVPVFIIAALLLPRGEVMPPPPAEAGSRAPVPAKGWIQCILVVFMFVCYVSFPLNVAMYITAEGLGDAAAAGLAMSIITVVGAALGVVFQSLIKAVKLFIGTFASLFGFLGMLVICLAGDITMIYVSAALLGLFFGAQISSGGYIISRICKPEQIAPTFSIIMSFMTLGVILSPVIINIITVLWGGVGSKGAFITSTVVFGIIVVAQIIWNIYLTKTCPPVEAPAQA